MIATAPGIAGMKAYRDDVRAHAASFGRNPDDVKVLFLVYPIIAETDEEAFAKHERIVATPRFVERALANASINTDIDFSQFDLDQPLPEVSLWRRKVHSMNLPSAAAAKIAPTGHRKIRRWRVAVDRLTRSRRLAHGRSDAGGRRRRLSDQHAVHEGEPPAGRRGDGRTGARIATPRPGADGLHQDDTTRDATGVLILPAQPLPPRPWMTALEKRCRSSERRP